MKANNLFIISGNLTKEPVLRQTKTGKNFCYLNLAVDAGYGSDAKPDFITVTVWGKQAENAAKYLIKGQSVNVGGTIASYFDKDKILRINLNAQEVQFGRKPQLAKDKEQPIANDKIEAAAEEAITEPEPIEPPEEFFSAEPEEDAPEI